MSTDHVKVTLPDYSYKTYARCTAERSDDGSVHVSTLDTEYLMDSFAPGTWRDATGYDRRGYTTFFWKAEETTS